MKEGWQTRPFESCIVPVAYTRKIQRKDFLDAGRFPIISQEAAFTNGFWDREADVFKVVRPVVIFGDHTQVLKYVDFDFVLGADGVKILCPRDFLHPKFFFYQLQAVSMPALGYARHYRLLKALQISFPALEEQQQIVDRLDETFAGVALVKANSEHNLRNSQALFKSYLQSVFTGQGRGWKERGLEDVCLKITDGTHHSPRVQYSVPGQDRVLYLTSKNVRNNHIDLSEVSYIDRTLHDEIVSRCAPEPGDVLLTKDGAGTGNVTLNTIDEPFSLLSSVCLIKTNPRVLKPGFLCYYLQSSVGLQRIVGKMTGAAIRRIVLKDIKKAVIPFPSTSEQTAIVERLDALLYETQCLEGFLQQKLVSLDSLKKSILQRVLADKA